MELKIAHLAFTVSDMDQALDFYCNGLGCKHAFSLTNKETGEKWIEYLRVGEGQFIELFYPGKDFVPGDKSYLHLCIEVPDCEGFVKELEGRGVKIVTYPRKGRDHNTQAWIADPDGNRIELMQISPDSPQKANW